MLITWKKKMTTSSWSILRRDITSWTLVSKHTYIYLNCTCLWFIMICHNTVPSFIWHALFAWLSSVALIKHVAYIRITLILIDCRKVNVVQINISSLFILHCKFSFSAIFILVNLDFKHGFIFFKQNISLICLSYICTLTYS